MKPIDLERKDRVLDFTSYALTTQKNNKDSWMVGFVSKANAMFSSLGQNRRLRYKGDKIQDLNQTL